MPASLNRIASAIALDQWENISEDDNLQYPNGKNKVLVFKTDPLYFVCSQVRQGKAPYQIYPYFEEIFKNSRDESVLQEGITPEDVMTATTIRRYYKKNYMFNRLKDKPLGKFEKELYDMLEDEKFLDEEKIRILVKLPTLYDYDVKTEEIFSRHSSVQKPRNRTHEIDAVCKFAGALDKNTLKKKYTAFYWTMPDNTLVVITVDHQSKGLDCWRYVAEKGKVGIRASASIGSMNGGDFLVYQLGKEYELYDSEDK